VVVVTDGYVGGEQQIVGLLHGRLPESCRLHVLGVGAAVNRSLATALARAGRGVEVVAGIDEDPERPAARLIQRTRSPVLVDVRIAGSALIAQAPERMPDVFAGAPIVAALALRPEGGELVVRGTLARDTWEQRVRVPARRPGEGNQAFAALYARERVADLEARSTVGEHFDREIEGLGLEFQIATRLTSWIAIDEHRKVAGPGRTEVMPQELPYGTSAASFGLRGGVEITGESSFEGSFSLDTSMLDAPMEPEATSLGIWGADELRSLSADAPAPDATKAPVAQKTLLGSASPAVPKPMPAPAEQPVPGQVEPSGRKQAPMIAGPRAPAAAPMKEAESLEMSKLAARRASRPSYRWSLLLLLLALISALLWWLVR
jgi:Ca-activated chloride channel family protein